MTAASLPVRPLPRSLVITGATGFVGRRVLHALLARDAEATLGDVTLLVRDPASAALPTPRPSTWRAVACDLATEQLPAGAIPPGSVVLHLAAATGRLSPPVMRAVNVDGTRRLTAAAQAAGASHLILVSSIAAGFADRRWYHYAEAKREAEQIVAGSDLPCTIVRPTMVFGPGSPVQEGLERLATGGVPIVLGSGEVAVQPVHVDDLAALLVALAAAPPEGCPTLEVGGGERLTLRGLLAQMRAAHGLPSRDPWSVPLAAPRLLLAVAERLIGTRLPVTAGQLASFVNDSTASPNDLVRRLLPAARPLRAMLTGRGAVMAGDAEPADAVAAAVASPPQPNATDEFPARVAQEFAIFARYLGTASPGERSLAAYARAHASAAAVRGDRFDRWLVSVASRSPFACGLADAYARVVRPYGPLRRRLVLALAVLESSATEHADYDTARPSSRWGAWAAVVALGAGWALRTLGAVVLLAPLQLAARLAGEDAPRG